MTLGLSTSVSEQLLLRVLHKKATTNARVGILDYLKRDQQLQPQIARYIIKSFARTTAKS